ncbi:MAG: nucleotidyltransferase domain-containing protein [Anaerolinea sp.]|nr:nucleotidyltransferase domain-containing protein [Anaerolinea sp.]
MLDQKTINFLKKIIRIHIPDKSYKTFIFGSRATNTNRKYSDIDLGIMGPSPLPSKAYISIDQDFQESDLPYKVDLVDFSNVTEKFKQVSLSSIINL